MALMHMTARWAAERRRELRVFTVDHGLQRESAGWAAFVGQQACAIGLYCSVLRWTGPKPATGLPAAARDARHRLLADAARQAGAAVLLLGHTADDIVEGERMRAEGSTLGALREWGPSPVWPAGRGLFLLRPLLSISRASLRMWLTAEGVSWIEDPANADLRYARSRARRHGGEPLKVLASAETPVAGADCTVTDDGRIVLDPSGLDRRTFSAAITCAAGGEGPIRAERLKRLLDQLAATDPLIAALAGARVTADEGQVTVARNPGERARGGLAPLPLAPGRPAVWDGRFELVTDTPGLTVTALAGHAARLSGPERQALRRYPAHARGAFPVAIDAAGAVTCPLLALRPVQACCLVADRFAAATGRVLREP
jgi:tRNA(Ile)-lysidine synthase